MIPSRHSRLCYLDAPEARDVSYPQPFDGHTLAYALGLRPAALWFFVLKAYTLYSTVEISKKSGGVRTLHIPDNRLMRAQRRILRTFLHAVDYPPWVSAYVPGRAIIDAARVHAGRPALIVLDLENFFTSTRRAWVRDAFKREFGLSDLATQLLATLVTAPTLPGINERFIIPQGAPTSGATANIVAMHRLDPHVLAVCERYGMDYTRYADDLAFSRIEPIDRSETEAFIYEIIRAVRSSGYRVNYDKIRVQRQAQQQRLLGLTINAYPNLPKRAARQLRALVHQCTLNGYEQTAAKYGFEGADAVEAYVKGMLAYTAGVCPERASRWGGLLRAGLLVPSETPDCRHEAGAPEHA